MSNPIDKMFRLDGQVVVVTGGAGLYGKPISTALAQAGASVIIASRNITDCQQVADELKKQQLKAEGLALDLSSESSIEKFTSHIQAYYGRIDVLVVQELGVLWHMGCRYLGCVCPIPAPVGRGSLRIDGCSHQKANRKLY